MYTHSIKSCGGAGIRFFLCFIFTLPLFAYIASHVNSGCFVSINAVEEHHLAVPSPADTPPAAELQEEEFDEAIIPKTLHVVLQVFELSQPFRVEQPAYPRSPCPGGFLNGRSGAGSPAPLVLRC